MDKKQAKKIIDNIKGKKQGQALRFMIDEEIEGLKEEAVKTADTMEEVYGCRNAIDKLKSFKTKLKETPNQKPKNDYS